MFDGFQESFLDSMKQKQTENESEVNKMTKDNRVFSVGWLYDSYYKKTIIKKLDKDGNQIGNVILADNSSEAAAIIKELKKEVKKNANAMENLYTDFVWFWGSREEHQRSIRKDSDGKLYVYWYGSLVEVVRKDHYGYKTVESY